MNILSSIKSYFFPPKKSIFEIPLEIPERYNYLQGYSPNKPINFGRKTTWCAVKCDDSELVAQAIFNGQYKPCDWVEGMIRAYDVQGTFVLPPINGWVLIHGIEIPQPNNKDLFKLTEDFINKLSLQFGEAQYFGSYRVSDFYCWAKSQNGQLTRLYMVGDAEEQLILGKPTPVEKNLDFGDDEVLLVAENWSVNPSTIESLTGVATSGFYGSLRSQ